MSLRDGREQWRCEDVPAKVHEHWLRGTLEFFGWRPRDGLKTGAAGRGAAESSAEMGKNYTFTFINL
jgi:hypothetical protein